MKKKFVGLIICIIVVSQVFIGCNQESDKINNIDENEIKSKEESSSELNVESPISNETEDVISEESITVSSEVVQEGESSLGYTLNTNTIELNGITYNIISVDGGDTNGFRQPRVAVDVGFGDRQYWAFTNEYGQLIYVIAENIVLQNDDIEEVNNDGRYYDDEANVPGTENDNLDQGHVIADSLGGVSNAYNITPQNSTLNRSGNQAYMEKIIRDAGGCEKFVVTITYPDTVTQIPSRYRYEYILNGNPIIDEFDNVNSDEDNYFSDISETSEENITTEIIENNSIETIDLDGNGKVTIKEAKAAGYKMPIDSSHWLYKYMQDNDNDGMVGE